MDPVKDILSTSGWFTRLAPQVGPYPVRMLMTPGGNPASVISLPRYKEESGVCSAIFMITVQPAARAGESFHATVVKGKFQGIICPLKAFENYI